jgi:chromate transport protein ChrA
MKGLIVAIICTFLTGFYELVANGGVVNWLTLKPVVIAVLGAAVSYLTKNLLTNSKGEFMTGEPVK